MPYTPTNYIVCLFSSVISAHVFYTAYFLPNLPNKICKDNIEGNVFLKFISTAKTSLKCRFRSVFFFRGKIFAYYIHI